LGGHRWNTDKLGGRMAIGSGGWSLDSATRFITYPT
jgi:hypothetical protein